MHSFTEPQRPSPRKLRTIGIVALIVAIALAALGIARRTHGESILKRKLEENAATTVAVIAPSRGDSKQELVLPGSVQAYYDAPIYARVPGYLKKWYVDIGARVQAGDLLAEIETPELDQQVRQAQADLATAVAKEKLAGTTAKRWDSMLASTSVSKQEADEKNGDFEAKRATVTAERANVERLQALTSFKRIVAPFAGVITARKTDIGALINAGSSSGPELFRIADTHKLRVYVQVPQSFADRIEIGMRADLRLPEQAGRSYPAVVVNTSNAINETSRTLLVQLEVDNAQGKLISGSYADIHFDLPAAVGVLQLPVTALLFRKDGLKIATLGGDGKATLKRIELGRDFGTRVEVVSGLQASDRVIDSPPDWLAQGDPVRAAEPEQAATKVADRKAAVENTGSAE
jgi:RND family efflux transporter MFP subunit